MITLEYAIAVGAYVIQRYRKRAQATPVKPWQPSGHYTVACQLKKQGFPLEMALLILCGKEVRQ